MSLLTLLPLDLLQLHAALEHGYWYARSAEFMGPPLIEVLVWMRVPGDTIFSVGALLFAGFVARQWIRPSRVRVPRPSAA
jgi:nitric oxide reductase subunit B